MTTPLPLDPDHILKATTAIGESATQRASPDTAHVVGAIAMLTSAVLAGASVVSEALGTVRDEIAGVRGVLNEIRQTANQMERHADATVRMRCAKWRVR